jgi:glutamate synthase domain-containing protein 2
MRTWFVVISCFVTSSILAMSWAYDLRFLLAFVIFGPLIIMGIIDMLDRKHTIIHNYPLFGRFRYVMEELRPKIYQYFIESDTDGTPLNRITRSVVYQRAKKENDTTPFGTELDVYAPGYEWINHSMYPINTHKKPDELRVLVGGKDCKKPYSLSRFNISAMSYGALSKNAVESLNWGAKEGKFAHNTGEGGLTPYHLKHGGDVIWQIGTGYFSCRDEKGNFSVSHYKEKATLDNVKMIEIKLSQGAKPGHGGILPAAKNTPEIAAIRGVKAGTTVFSPPAHTSFNSPEGLLDFVALLREHSGGKPVGFKLCVGHPEEFEAVVKAMLKTGILPDFITVDGGEGGTGAAPIEFSNYVGTPLREGLLTVTDTLMKYNLRKNIRVICSGKIITGFDVVKMLALGADTCNSARGMMLALGCIQALVCNKNKCPTGVATQDPSLYKGLIVEEKYIRVANFHHMTLESVAEIFAAAGIKDLDQLGRHHIWRRISALEYKNYAQLFPYPNMKLTASA